jgi:hypothetical protein
MAQIFVLSAGHERLAGRLRQRGQSGITKGYKQVVISDKQPVGIA